MKDMFDSAIAETLSELVKLNPDYRIAIIRNNGMMVAYPSATHVVFSNVPPEEINLPSWATITGNNGQWFVTNDRVTGKFPGMNFRFPIVETKEVKI